MTVRRCLGWGGAGAVDVDPDGPDPDPDADTDTGVGAGGQRTPEQGAGGSDPSGRAEALCPRSPIAEATRQVLAAVAANDAEQAAAEAAAAAAAERAAAKAREATSRRHAHDAAATVFAPHTHTGGAGTPATWTTRPPIPAERAAARRLARQLRAASHRDRAATHVTSKAPPGRLQVRAALAADAQRTAGLPPTAEPWARTVHRHVPSPPLKVGIAVDVSRSMQPFAKPLASAAWILARAAGWSYATAATVCFGEQVTAVTRPGQVPAQVREFAPTTPPRCSARPWTPWTAR